MTSFIFNLALLLDRLARLTPACLYALGAAVAAHKVLLLPAWAAPKTLAGIAAIIWLLAAAADTAKQFRTPYGKEYATAWLDWKNESGGAVLAGKPTTPLRVKPALTFAPLLKSLALPVVFVAAAFLLPAMQAPAKADTAFLRAKAAEAEELVKERTDFLAAPDEERLTRQLEELQQLAESNPEAAAEALASFEKRLAEAESLRLERAAETLEAAADLLNGAPPEALQNAMEEAVRGEGGLEALPENLRSAWSEAGQNSTGQQQQRLTEALKEWSEQLTNSQAQTGSSNGAAGNPGTGENAGSAARDRLQSATEALDALDQAKQQARAGQGNGQGAGAGDDGRSFGSGGVSRGRADAPLLLGRPSEPGNATSTLTPLPKGDSGTPGEMILRDRRPLPDDLPPEEFRAPWTSAHDAPNTVRAGRAPANLGPARARAVERYFNSIGNGAE